MAAGKTVRIPCPASVLGLPGETEERGIHREQDAPGQQFFDGPATDEGAQQFFADMAPDAQAQAQVRADALKQVAHDCRGCGGAKSVTWDTQQKVFLCPCGLVDHTHTKQVSKCWNA